MRIAVELLNGQTLCGEVMLELTMRELKREIKGMQTWDELSRDTTIVEVIVGAKKVKTHETVESNLLADSKLSAVFRKNVVRCSDKSRFGQDLDAEALVVLEIPDLE